MRININIKKKILLGIAIVFTIIVSIGAYHFFRGRLSFINPFVIGFDKLISEKAQIYYHSDEIMLSDFLKIDSLIEEVENFHNLQFNSKIDIVISTNKSEHETYSGKGVTFIAQPPSGRIYLPYMDEYFTSKTFELKKYLQHELSHSIVYQNISITNLVGYPLWFLEGIATYSSGMMGIDAYPTKDTVYSRIRRGYFIAPDDWGQFGMPSKGKSVQQYPYNDTYYFAYSEFGYIIEDLIITYGKEKLVQCLALSLKTKDFLSAFTIVYNLSFSEYLNNYLDQIKIQ